MHRSIWLLPFKCLAKLCSFAVRLVTIRIFWIFSVFFFFSYFLVTEFSKSNSSLKDLEKFYSNQPSLPYDMDLTTLFQGVDSLETETSFFVLSAFKDPRTPRFIKVIGVGHKNATQRSFFCHFLLDNQVVSSSSVMKIEPLLPLKNR